MIVKSFVLRIDSVNEIVSQCKYNTISIIRLEQKLNDLFYLLINKSIINKEAIDNEIIAITSYLNPLFQDFAHNTPLIDFIEFIKGYLTHAISYNVPISSITDYLLAQCTNVCAKAISQLAGVNFMDGRELVVCEDKNNINSFNWNSTLTNIRTKCHDKQQLVISGGYARTLKGEVLSIGKGGANLMASLVGAAMNADRIELFVDNENVHNVSSITYEEAAHLCSSNSAPFPSIVLWPAKNAHIPIVVKYILNNNSEEIIISSIKDETYNNDVSGILVDNDLSLITVYGTGLLGHIGASSAIFSSLAAEKINIRFISQTTSEFAISFAVSNDNTEKVSNILNNYIVNNPIVALDDIMVIKREVAVITMYGSRMKNVPGISGKIFSLLGNAGINVIASAQGGEELSISVVVDLNDTSMAKNILSTLC